MQRSPLDDPPNKYDNFGNAPWRKGVRTFSVVTVLFALVWGVFYSPTIANKKAEENIFSGVRIITIKVIIIIQISHYYFKLRRWKTKQIEDWNKVEEVKEKGKE